MKKILTVFLLCISLICTACSIDTQHDETVERVKSLSSELPLEDSILIGMSCVQNSLYIALRTNTADNIYTIDKQNWSWTHIYEFPEDTQIVDLFSVGDNLGVLCNSDINCSNQTIFLLSSVGKVLDEFSLCNDITFTSVIYQDSSYYCSNFSCIVQYNTEKDTLTKLDVYTDEIIESIASGDNSVMACIYNISNSQTCFYQIVPEDFELSFKLFSGPIKKEVTGISDLSGNNFYTFGDYELGVINSSDNKYSTWGSSSEIGISGQDIKKIFSWNNFLILFQPGQNRLHLAQKCLGPKDTRTELVFVCEAMIPMPSIEALVEEFNKSNEKFYVTLKYLDSTNYTEEMLRLDILTGNAPDIYRLSDYGIMSHIQDSKYFIDLYDLLDNDINISRNSFVPNLLPLVERNNKLSFLPTSFSITTCIIPSSIWDQPTIELKELSNLSNLYNDFSIFPSWMTSEILLINCCPFIQSEFIDFDNGKCMFDSPEFIEYLSMCKKLVTDKKSSGYDDGLLTIWYLTQPQFLVSNDWTYVGFPTSKECGSLLESGENLAISTQCKYQDAAWEFLKLFFSKNYQMELPLKNGGNFPSVNQFLALTLENELLQEQNESNEKHILNRVALTQNDIARFYDLLSSLELRQNCDPALNDIIIEEASSFFSGEKDAELVAKQIQSRSTLYLIEQLG